MYVGVPGFYETFFDSVAEKPAKTAFKTWREGDNLLYYEESRWDGVNSSSGFNITRPREKPHQCGYVHVSCIVSNDAFGNEGSYALILLDSQVAVRLKG